MCAEPPVNVIGAGPAGCAAAIAALRQGRAVRLFEKSVFPRHKVCGEFLSPGVQSVLEALGVWSDFRAAEPAPIERIVLHTGHRELRAKLPEPAFGLSRWRLDSLLLQYATTLGAGLTRQRSNNPDEPVVIASGRSLAAPRGSRLFGFKAHFSGPVTDAVELFFFNRCYVGIGPVESGLTNVCGLAPEDALRSRSFEPELLLGTSKPLAARVAPLSRTMEWLITGPLVFARRFDRNAGDQRYFAGDALRFVDPFTGTGILNALLTGEMAGRAAAEGMDADSYLAQCSRVLSRPFGVASLLRRMVWSGWAEALAPFVPARWLFRLTRPAVPS